MEAKVKLICSGDLTRTSCTRSVLKMCSSNLHLLSGTFHCRRSNGRGWCDKERACTMHCLAKTPIDQIRALSYNSIFFKGVIFKWVKHSLGPYWNSVITLPYTIFTTIFQRHSWFHSPCDDLAKSSPVTPLAVSIIELWNDFTVVVGGENTPTFEEWTVDSWSLLLFPAWRSSTSLTFVSPADLTSAVELDVKHPASSPPTPRRARGLCGRDLRRSVHLTVEPTSSLSEK